MPTAITLQTYQHAALTAKALVYQAISLAASKQSQSHTFLSCSAIDLKQQAQLLIKIPEIPSIIIPALNTLPEGTNYFIHTANLDESFQELAILGHGSFGTVYQIQSLQDHTVVYALKQLYPPATSLQTEIDTLQALGQLHQYDKTQISMLYHPGITLAKLIERHPQRLAEHAVEIAIQLTHGIANFHDRLAYSQSYDNPRYMVHGDLKPSNIIVNLETQPLSIHLIDFDTTQFIKTPKHTAQACTGTPQFMAPEVFNAHTVSQASDIFSLGIILSKIFDFPEYFYSLLSDPEDRPTAKAIIPYLKYLFQKAPKNQITNPLLQFMSNLYSHPRNLSLAFDHVEHPAEMKLFLRQAASHTTLDILEFYYKRYARLCEPTLNTSFFGIRERFISATVANQLIKSIIMHTTHSKKNIPILYKNLVFLAQQNTADLRFLFRELFLAYHNIVKYQEIRGLHKINYYKVQLISHALIELSQQHPARLTYYYDDYFKSLGKHLIIVLQKLLEPDSIQQHLHYLIKKLLSDIVVGSKDNFLIISCIQSISSEVIDAERHREYNEAFTKLLKTLNKQLENAQSTCTLLWENTTQDLAYSSDMCSNSYCPSRVLCTARGSTNSKDFSKYSAFR